VRKRKRRKEKERKVEQKKERKKDGRKGRKREWMKKQNEALCDDCNETVPKRRDQNSRGRSGFASRASYTQ
jgi:hypothetical protein